MSVDNIIWIKSYEETEQIAYRQNIIKYTTNKTCIKKYYKSSDEFVEVEIPVGEIHLVRDGGDYYITSKARDGINVLINITRLESIEERDIFLKREMRICEYNLQKLKNGCTNRFFEHQIQLQI